MKIVRPAPYSRTVFPREIPARKGSQSTGLIFLLFAIRTSLCLQQANRSGQKELILGDVHVPVGGTTYANAVAFGSFKINCPCQGLKYLNAYYI